MDYFSEAIRFEEDFQKILCYECAFDFFLIDDILRTMAMNQKSYFVLNKENAKDGRSIAFILGWWRKKRVIPEIEPMHADSKIVVSRARYGRGKSNLGKVAYERQKISCIGIRNAILYLWSSCRNLWW